jgi:hypothetical protein
VKLSMEEDYDIGHSIRTSLIPEAVLWYTGEAIEEDDEGDYEEVRSAFVGIVYSALVSIYCYFRRHHLLGAFVDSLLDRTVTNICVTFLLLLSDVSGRRG